MNSSATVTTTTLTVATALMRNLSLTPDVALETKPPKSKPAPLLGLSTGTRKKIDLDHVRCRLLAESETDGKHQKRRDLIGREGGERAVADAEAGERISVLHVNEPVSSENLGEARSARAAAAQI